MALLDRYEARMTDQGIQIFVGVDSETPSNTLLPGQSYDIFIEFYDTVNAFLTQYADPTQFNCVEAILTQDVYRIDVESV